MAGGVDGTRDAVGAPRMWCNEGQESLSDHGIERLINGAGKSNSLMPPSRFMMGADNPLNTVPQA